MIYKFRHREKHWETIIQSLSRKFKKLPTLSILIRISVSRRKTENSNCHEILLSLLSPATNWLPRTRRELIHGLSRSSPSVSRCPFFSLFSEFVPRTRLDKQSTRRSTRAHVRRGITRYGTISRRNDAAISGIMVIRGTVAYRRLIRSVAIRAFREGDDPVW